MSPTVTFLGHASVLIDTGRTQVLTDPLLFSRVAFLGRVSAEVFADEYAQTDLVLISHMHADHCDLRSLRTLEYATIVVPVGSAAWLRSHGVHNVVELPIGQSLTIDDVTVTTTPAIHDGRRLRWKGPDADAVGYVIETKGPAPADNTTVYFAGDTDLFDEMTDLPGVGSQGIDLALLPVWGWGPNLGPGHMNPERAAHSLDLLQPSLAVPIHWGTFFPVGLRRLKPSLGSLLSEPPFEFVRHAEQRSAQHRVQVVQPGGVVSVGNRGDQS